MLDVRFVVEIKLTKLAVETTPSKLGDEMNPEVCKPNVVETKFPVVIPPPPPPVASIVTCP